MIKPLVALVGRPNVGKSTLFNRIVGQRMAIVEDLPGTTRDRLYAESDWAGYTFNLVDTGGLEARVPETAGVMSVGSTPFVDAIRRQVEVAIEEADVIVFLVDGRGGLTSADEDVAELLRRIAKPVVLAVNKAESEVVRQDAVEFYALGLGEPFPISGYHGHGVGDLLDAVVEHLPLVPEEEEDDALRLAIVGRPNVGKSSLVNKLLRQDRTIVSEVPGTTRDAIDTPLRWEGRDIVLVDTAGIRRRGRIEPGIEKYSVLRALRAMARADVVLLMIDATEKVTAQDTHVAGYILEEAKSVIVLVNKWDLVEKDSYTMNEYTREVRAALNFMDYVPVLFVSAGTSQRLHKIIPLALQVHDERLVRIPTSELNRLVQEATMAHQPPSKSGRRLRFYYATQADVNPPTFVLFVNDPDLVHFSYQRFLENRIRERYPFVGTPLRMVFRRRESEKSGRGRK